MTPALRRPVILIGAARSGTKMLGETLNRHPDLFVLREPTAVWRYGRAYGSTDLRPPSDAKPAVCAYIRRAFEKELRASGKPRFAEKTPSNCLRIPFINAVFPDALFFTCCGTGGTPPSPPWISGKACATVRYAFLDRRRRRNVRAGTSNGSRNL